MSKRCQRCLNDKTVKHIKFNSEGLCSFCSMYDKYAQQLTDYDKLSEIFQAKIKNTGNHQYDVALSFSGGKDSTFVLYELKRKYALKIKAFTLDNGFMSDEAKQKINAIVQELNVEHEYVLCDEKILKQCYKEIVTKYLSPCIACAFLGYASMINYAAKIDAAVIIHGRSPYQIFRAFSEYDDYFKPFIFDGLNPSNANMNKLYDEALRLIDKLVDKNLASVIKNQVLADTKVNGYRPFIAYFLYHPYNKDQMIKTLVDNTSWRVVSEEEHFDCLIHHGALYLKNMIAKRNHLLPEVSTMIRLGDIDKSEGLKILSKKIERKVALDELQALCEYADINYQVLMLKATLYSKRWW